MHGNPVTFTSAGRTRLGFTFRPGLGSSMATTSATPYEDLRAGLARALRARRPACPPGETARLLLSYDGPTTALVGLSYDGERAVFHDRTAHRAIACRFDGSGLVDGAGVEIAAARDRAGFRRWIGKMGPAYWGWLNPRYRDALDDP